MPLENIKLADNFTLFELIKSQTATRHKIDNTPDATQIENLRRVCTEVLQRVRTHWAKPVKVSSGFRSAALNKLIGSSSTSQHTKGQAVDFEVPGVSNLDVATWIRDNLSFDQLILEFWDGLPNSNASYVSAATNRKQTLTINHSGTFAGFTTTR